MKKISLQTSESFWNKVKKDSDKCWPWIGTISGTGYGQVRWSGKSYLPHRIAAWLSGKLKTLDFDGDTLVCHTCDTPLCCNPDHLYIGNDLTNAIDLRRRNRRKYKFTDNDIRNMRLKFNNGSTQAKLCKEYNASPSHMSNIIRGIRYYWIV